MASNVTELIIKVGKKSTLSFSHSTAYRVLTYDELVETYKYLSDCHMLIIEGIFNDEYDNIRDFVSNFLHSSNENKVWVYTEDTNDEITNGLVDELDLDIFYTKESLFRDIFDKTKLNISTDISLRKELGKLLETTDEFSGFEISFGDIVDETIENIEEVPDDIVADIKPKVSIVKKETESGIENSEAVKVDEPKRVTVELGKKDTVESIDIAKTDNDKYIEEKTSEATIKKDVSSTSVIDDSRVEEYEKELKQLNDKINNLIVENTELVNEVKQGNVRIENLSKLNKSLTDKYNVVISEYNAIMESDEVIEDPISLTVYSELKSNIKVLQDDLKDTKEEAEKERFELSEQIEEQNSQIEDLKMQLEASKMQVEAKKNEVILLNNKIASGELQSADLENAKRNIDKLHSEIDDLNIIIDGQTKDITHLRESMDRQSEQTDKESFGRKSSLEFSNLLIKKITIMNSELTKLRFENEQHRQSITNLQSSDKGNNDIIAGQTAEIMNLRRQLSDVDKKIAEAVENERYEKTLLSKKLELLQGDFDFQKEQLEFKEAQYNKLRALTTLDENGANVLEEDNKTLRDINNALREQLRLAKEETEKARKEKAQEQQAKHLIEDRLANAQKSLHSLKTSMDGGLSQSSNLPAINYQGKGIILPVFGCGSYGTTLTAVSLAKRLSANSKVLYIDLDLVAPKSDAFFNTPPVLRNLEGFSKENSVYYTGMGIFFEKGMSTLIHNHEQCIIHLEPSARRGCLDYLGGVYYKLDPVKILSADFSQLLNYYGNMYSHVVIDLGRIGSSDLHDKVIKVISDAASKSIGVTSSDVIDIRLLRMKMADAKLNLPKIAVLVNLSDSSKIDPKAAKFITPSLYGVMPFDNELYGNRRETFLERRLRDKFDNFISNAVFRN